ncbi:hypothetical protein GKE62_03305 [Novosphingobium sp. Gsoil 351]|nr:hypothetical protein GKE62_03305 [Novosphingobium sp. Gsoil 351]
MTARALWLAGGAVALSSAMVVAQDAPESLLPPGFDQPAPAPAPTPRPSARPAPAPGGGGTSVPMIQPLPGASGAVAPRAPAGPSIADQLDPALLQELIDAQRPRADIPAQEARSLVRAGLLDESEGGFAADDTRVLNGSFVRAVLEGTKRPPVSRWGSILLRRALVSRLTVPAGMNGADWVALRARVLLRMGEVDAARALVQQVDSGAFTPALENSALDAYLATSDILGACPIAAITAARRQEAEWQMIRQICRSFEGEGTAAMAELERLRRRGVGGGYENVDLLLAQKYAGSALESRKAVKIEWDKVEELTPWRYALALAVGSEPPEALLDKAGHRFDYVAARAPMLELDKRAAAADFAAARGILSSAALVDLWSQIYADDDVEGDWKGRSETLRQAYVATEPSARLSAMETLWGDPSDPQRLYSRHVLTAYAAARMPVVADFADKSGDLIASMLTAGLDRNAARWLPVVEGGSQGWALVVVGTPGTGQVGSSDLSTFRDDDPSQDAARSKLLLAGLYGLGRVDRGVAGDFAKDLGVDLNRQTKWSRAIRAAADSGNQTLVALLAGAGMQGESWSQMTPLALYHIVSALRRVGLEPEARMIAAEAVARA